MRTPFTLLALLVLMWWNGAACAQSSAQVSSSSTLPATTASAGNSDSSAPAVAGKIELLEGDVRIFANQKRRADIKVGDPVYEGDFIVAGADGEIHMSMADEGYIAVRPNTRMRIAQYRANGDAQDHGVIGLLSGSLRTITGWIGKYRPKAYVIRTPDATIGIRGTDHEPKVIPQGSSEGDPGTYDKVNIGGTTLRTAQGSVDVQPNRAAYAPHGGGPGKPGAAGPRLLDRIPGFFKPTRNERLLEGKHEQVQHRLEQRRNERRQKVMQTAQRGEKKAAGNPGNAPGQRMKQPQIKQENAWENARENAHENAGANGRQNAGNANANKAEAKKNKRKEEPERERK